MQTLWKEKKVLRKEIRRVSNALPSHIVVEGNNCIKKDIILMEFNRVRKEELNTQWKKNKERGRRKKTHLKDKYNPEPQPVFEDIEYGD